MGKTLLADSLARGLGRDVTLARGTGWGLIGGLVATLVMDLVLVGVLSVAGLPSLLCFSIVGDTAASFFAIMGVEMGGGIPLGIATHYLIGPSIGALFGAAVAKVDALRVDTLKKGVVLAVLYVEILSQPLLVTTPILLKMTTPETFQWFGVSFLMHLIAGAVLGLVICYGLCPATRSTRR